MKLPIPVILENRPCQMRQTGWTSVVLPESLPKGALIRLVRDDVQWSAPAVSHGDQVFCCPTLEAGSRLRAWVAPDVDGAAAPAFAFHPWVADDPMKLVPLFIGRDEQGVEHRSNPFAWQGHGVGDFVEKVEDNPARLRFHWRTRIPALRLNLEGWTTIWCNHPAVEWIARASYGTTQPGEPRERVLGSLSMLTGEEPSVDWRVRLGLHPPMWRQDLGAWETELAVPQSWFRCRTVEAYGAILCVPGNTKFVEEAPAGPSRDALLARRQGPITALADPQAVWQGKLGAFFLPRSWAGAATEQARRLSSMLARLQTPGNYFDSRPYAQPPNSGQTGDQPDFGATRCEHAIGFPEPWALFDLRHSAQAWLARPYANREPDGSPVQAVNHPGAKLYGLRPDERFGTDMLGWPKPVGWISGYTTSDSQHRSDNLLFQLYRLTKDPSLERTIRDLIELNKMELDQGEPQPGQGIGSPRAAGRVLISMCHGLQAGFTEFEPMIRKMVRRAHVAASYRTLPPSAQVRPYSSNESKYGWNNPDGSAIRAWLPWQDGIACMGFYGAWHLLGIPEAKELCVVGAASLARWGWFQLPDGTWKYCYAVRWLQDGEPLPEASYNLGQPNYDVFVTGDTSSWSIPALFILNELDPQHPHAERARSILSYFRPSRWDHLCWNAVVA